MDLTIENQQLHFSSDPKLLSKKEATIIFLHDSLGCIELWRNFPKKIGLGTSCNILAYDRQGYGKSCSFTSKKRDKDYLKHEAETLGKILEKTGLKKVILFGHSDGGSIALLAAALFPENIIGIITEGAHVFVENETINGIKDAVNAYKNTNLRDRLYKYHGSKTDDVFKMWTETWLSPSYQSWNIEEYLPLVQCPSLIIQGEKDEYGTMDQVSSIVSKTTGESKPLIIDCIGHTPHKESTDIVIGNTIEFIRKIHVSR